jgi:hypothetical protein
MDKAIYLKKVSKGSYPTHCAQRWQDRGDALARARNRYVVQKFPHAKRSLLEYVIVDDEDKW